MARLIDADALNKELQKRLGSPTDDKLYDVNLCIIDAPTIDAIPVEWLEKLRKDERLTIDDVETIDWLLWRWEADKEEAVK